MDLPSPQRERDAMKDRLILHAGVQITDLKQGGGVGSNHWSEAVGRTV